MDTVLAKQNNEREVKTYHCTRWVLPKLDGHLTVTTERVIFHGASTPTPNGKPTNRIVQEVELKSISGLSSYYGTKINWIWLVVGFALLLGGLGAIGAGGELLGNSYIPLGMQVGGGLLLLAGIAAIIGSIAIVVLLAFGKAFFLNIYSAQSAGAPISIGNADRANHVLLSLCGQPTDQTDDIMKELGALITDLKADKKEALKAWGSQ